jgi:hypothetical protein
VQLASKHVDAQDAKEEKEEAKEHGHVAQLCARGGTENTVVRRDAMTTLGQEEARARRSSSYG